MIVGLSGFLVGLGGQAGTAGYVLVSQGPGRPPVWKPQA